MSTMGEGMHVKPQNFMKGCQMFCKQDMLYWTILDGYVVQRVSKIGRINVTSGQQIGSIAALERCILVKAEDAWFH